MKTKVSLSGEYEFGIETFEFGFPIFFRVMHPSPALDLFCFESHFPVGLLGSDWKMGWEKGQDEEKTLWTMAKGSRAI